MLAIYMEWGLFVVAVLLVALLQFVVWRRLQRGDVDATDAANTATSRDATPPHEPGPTEDATDPEDPDLTLCPSCGAENDADYRFCRQCVGTLYL